METPVQCMWLHRFKVSEFATQRHWNKYTKLQIFELGLWLWWCDETKIVSMTPANIYEGKLCNNSYRLRSDGPAFQIEWKVEEVSLLKLKKNNCKNNWKQIFDFVLKKWGINVLYCLLRFNQHIGVKFELWFHQQLKTDCNWKSFIIW